MMKFLNGIYSMIIVVGILVTIVIYSCFSERGLIKVISLKSELRKMEEFNNNLQLENEELKEYIILLNEDPRYIEKLAREELGLLEKEELVYFFEYE